MNDKKLTLSERIKIWFPERQLYLRSNGNVRFVSLSTRVQVAMTTVLAIALLWSISMSVGYFLKNSVIADKNNNIHNLQSANQRVVQEMSDLQQQFIKRTEAIESRQAYIETILKNDPVFEKTKEALPDETVDDADEASDEAPVETPTKSDKPVTPKKTEPNQNFGDNIGDNNENAISNSDLLLEELNARLQSAAERQTQTTGLMLEYASLRKDGINQLLKGTGLNSSDLANEWTGPGQTVPQGGPYLPVAAPFDTASPKSTLLAKIDKDILALNNMLVDIHKAEDAILSIPTIVPPESYYVSSKFGKRIDPIRKTPSYHWGLDMASWPGIKVRAGGAGKVIKSGWKAAYGNMIEIDHGNGFRTRYGHMRKLLVKKDQMVEPGQTIGEIGCSGRCTSPHLHYEVWFKDKPRNPLPFIKAADNVLENQKRHKAH